LASGLKKPLEYRDLWNTILSGNDWTGEFQNKKKSGEFYWVSALISPIKDTRGKTIYFLALEEDITERKKTEFELIRSKEQAEEMNRLKSVFLANMSHELRTPMVGILGFSQILRDELTDQSKIEIAELLIKSGKRLLTTLESILDFSQLESKQIDMNPVNINLSEKTEELIKNFNERLTEKKLKLNLQFNYRKLHVLADERLVNQVLNNIIDNAIKFTLKGEISIETDEIIEDNATWGIVKISDTGIGISKEKQKIIFEDFRQASEGRTRSFEGNGLGLTVANKMVEMLNGFITVESEPGKGSTFTVYLPAVLENKDKNEEQIVKDKDQLPEILLVEDSEMNKAVVMIYLKKVCKVDYAKDGHTAVQMALQKKYSAILMDINLGNGMSGIDVMKRIKENNGYKDIPFVAITGYARFGDKEKLLEEGCTHYLSKPFLKETLVGLITELLYKGKYSKN
jgi:signal transduction histidine kinase/ActR/RegA family two-component response regulator